MSRRDPLEDTAQKLMYEIQHQVRPRGVVLASACIDCQQVTHSGGACPECLTKGLAYIVGSAIARQYLTAQLQLRDAERAVLQTVRGTQ